MSVRLGRSVLVIALAVAACVAPAGVANAAPTGLDRTIVHQAPSVPVTIDGVAVGPDAVTRYNGRPLYYAALPEGGPHGSLAVFTDPAAFEKFVSARGGPPHALAVPPERPSTKAVAGPVAGPSPAAAGVDEHGYTYIYEHADFLGAWLGMYAGWGAYDLTEWDISCTLWFCDEWNDEASSLWADNARGQTVYEHIGWSGSALWTPGGSWRAHLGPLGWGDRVSSFGSHA